MIFTEREPSANIMQLRERRAETIAIVVLAYAFGQYRIQVVQYPHADDDPGDFYEVIGPAEF